MNKYTHLKILIHPKKFKYVLLNREDAHLGKMKCFDDLFKLNEPSAIFISQNELSLIIPDTYNLEVPHLKIEDNWCCFQIIGEMPFGTVQGLISKISSTLFQENIGVCVVSTFKTDFFFIRNKHKGDAQKLLLLDGWEILNDEYQIEN